MADLPESNDWVPGIYQLETSDPVLGGAEGIDNLQAKQLASRTRWLKILIESVIDGTKSIAVALRLKTPRQILLSGAATGSTSFDGSADVEISVSLAEVPWSKIGSGKPTTLSGYGIKDGLAIGQYGLGGTALAAESIDDRTLKGGFYYFGEGPTSFANYVGLLNLPYGREGFSGQLGFVQGAVDVAIVARSVNNDGKWTPTRTLWHNGNFNPEGKADKATTLAGYGIKDALAVGQYGLGGTALKADSIDDRSLKGGFYYFGEGASSFANYVGLLNLPYGEEGYSGQLGFVQGATDVSIVVRSVTNGGTWTPTRTLWHNGNFKPESKADKATTLAGYGIQVATQSQVDSGNDDGVAVTPRKLRWGFQILQAVNGYIAFPTWLGGFVLQWGYYSVEGNASSTFPFPLTFPNRCTAVVASFGIPAQGVVNVAAVNRSQLQLQNTFTGSQSASWIAVGY